METTSTQAVSVVVPAKVATPHDCNGSGRLVVGKNYAENATTTPAQPKIPEDQVVLVTSYTLPLTITFHDQFNQSIGDIYEGAAITETLQAQGPIGASINQALSPSSTYIDPVGVDINPRLNPIDGWPAALAQKSIVPAGSALAKAWRSARPLPVPDYHSVQDIGVEVDGFPLDPGIVDRKIEAKSLTQTFQIDWQCGGN